MDGSELDALQRRIDALRQEGSTREARTIRPSAVLDHRPAVLVTLRPRRSWRLSEVGAYAVAFAVPYFLVDLLLGLHPGSVLILLIGLSSLWSTSIGAVEVRSTGITPVGGTSDEFRWDEIEGITTKRWGMARRRTEGLEVATTRLTGKPRRLFLPLSPCEPAWRSTPLVELLHQHRPDLELLLSC